jgi:WD40 repeat protein
MSRSEKARNPYPGLTPFEEQDATRFFGRDKEVEEILDRLALHHLLAVIGVSGCGKSSLVRAGVIPVLRMGAAENLPTHWQIAIITPGNAPLQSLREELGAPPDWPSTSFDLVDHSQNQLSSNESLLLIVDQFEEIFLFREKTLAQDGGNESSLFVNLLLTAAEQHEVPIYVVLTMRSDFLGQCTQFRGLPEALNDSYYLVPRMTRLQQQEAIERPLREHATSMHAALVQRLLNESAEGPDHLPVLQHLLKRLWENWNGREKTPGDPIGVSDYDAVGGWSEALNRDAEAVLSTFQADTEGIRRVFQWITELGTGEKPMRRPRSFVECLEVSGLVRERLSDAIRSFQDRGLLRESNRSDQSLVDLSHESVMWQWPRLRRWIDEEAEQATQLRFFLQSARQRVPLTGLALESASQWRSGVHTQSHSALRYLNSEELELTVAWIVRSEQIEQAIQREQLKKVRWLKRWRLLAGSGMLLITIIAIWVARWQRNMADARGLAAWAATSLGEDPERSLILGLYSWDRERTSVQGLDQILHDTLLQSSSRLTLTGHQDYVLGVTWSPNGRRLATASSDRTVKVWEMDTGRELLTLSGHHGVVFSVAWSPDGKKLATSSSDQTVKVWEAGSGRELLTLSGHHGVVFSVAWSPDGKKLATSSSDQTTRVWDAETGRELLRLIGHQAGVKSVAWSPDGNKLATASEDKTARVWEATTGRELVIFRGHEASVLSIAWSPDSSKLATTSDDKTAKVWETATGSELLSLGTHQERVLCIAWSPDGNKLATANYDSTAKIWDATTSRELLTLRGHKDAVFSIAWSPDSSKVATASYDKIAKVWQAGSGHELLIMEDRKADINPGVIRSIAWSRNGNMLATAGDDKTVRVWDTDTGRKLLTWSGQGASILSIAWSPDSSKLATASDDKSTKVWDAKTGRELLTLSGHQKLVRSIVWSPDGGKLATASEDKTAKVWDAITGRELLTLSGHQGKASGIAWSPDGRKLATASDDKTARVWDAATGHELLILRGHKSFVRSIAWSPDGTKLATASDDGLAIVWDVGAGRELLSLNNSYRDAVLSIAWSPDGSKLATASKDETTRVWEIETRRELFTLHGHQGSVLSVAWSPDGKRLASAGDDKIVQVYAVDLVELLRLVRSRITRDLTSEECRRYLNIDRCPALPEVP